MTSCTPVLNLMSSFIEGKLGSDDEKVVWQHIDSCKACLEDYQQSLFLTHLLKENMTLPEPPADMGQTISRAVSRPGIAAAPATPASTPGGRRKR